MSMSKVAKLAGVSNSTVSRVINRHPRVAPETEKAVRKAMETLHYAPSDRRPGPKPNSGTVVATKTRVAFLMLGGQRRQATPAFEQLVHGVSIGAADFDMDLTFLQVPDVAHPDLKLDQHKIDGLLLHGDVGQSPIQEKLRKLPSVWLMGNRRRPSWGDQVLPDTFRIGELAARHLTGLGHKNLVFVNLDADHLPFKLVYNAFNILAGDAGAKTHVVAVKREATGSYWSAFSPEAVDELVRMVKEIPGKPTGIFIADDIQAALVQPALQRAGIKIGDGVDVVSCNNERPYLIGLNPTPTVIDIRVESIGRTGIEQLAWRLAHTSITERITIAIEPSLVMAESRAEGKAAR